MYTMWVLMLLLIVFTLVVPTQFTFMPTAISKITILVSLTIPHAAHHLTTMLLSMLDMTKMKDTGKSATHGALLGENLAT